MKSISRWLVPGFLRRLDQFLRERYSVIWYSGAHWVLFYGLLGGVVLFGAGLLYPVHWVTSEKFFDDRYRNPDRWVVNPIKPIEFAYDELFIYSLLLVFALACIWMYRQFQLRPFFYRIQHSVFCLLVYAGCYWVLCGITAVAFRMGTIVKTAWIWMPERDLQDFKQSGIYPDGFVLIAEDSTDFIPVDTFSFFKKRERIFKRIWENEEARLKQRYRVDPSYWKKRLAAFRRPYQSYLSDRSDLSDLSDWVYRSDRLNSLDRRDWSYQSYWRYRVNHPYLTYQSYLSYRSYLLYQSDGPDRFDWLYNSGRFDREYQLNLSYGSLQRTYLTRKKIKHPKASAYQLINYNDTSYYAYQLVVRPSLPRQIEAAVRSVEHARQFLREGIFWRYFWHLTGYLLWMAVLLLLLPWVSTQRVLPLSVGALLIWFGLKVFEVEGWVGYEKVWKSVHLTAYLLLPLTGLLLLLGMLWQQKQGQLFITAVNMVFLGVLIVLLGALTFNAEGIVAQFGSPIDAAFYGAQIIGLLAACIVPYVQAMPKTR